MLKAIVITLLCALMGAIGQVELKRGADVLEWTLFHCLGNYHLIAGLSLYAISTVLYIYALKIGGNLSILYPIIATSYIWVLLFSGVLFHEEIQTLNWIGAIILIIGITLVVWR